MVRNLAVIETSPNVVSSTVTFSWLNWTARWSGSPQRWGVGECISTYFWPIATATELRCDGFLNTNHSVDTESSIIDLFFPFTLIVFIAAKCIVPSSVKRLTHCARLKKKHCVSSSFDVSVIHLHACLNMFTLLHKQANNSRYCTVSCETSVDFRICRSEYCFNHANLFSDGKQLVSYLRTAPH